MKKFLTTFFCLLFVVSLLAGCGTKEKAEPTPAAGAPEEMADTTRMDSAMPDAPEGMVMDDTTAVVDDSM